MTYALIYGCKRASLCGVPCRPIETSGESRLVVALLGGAA